MCEKTCGDCREFIPVGKQCGHPMVYLNHHDNTHHTKSDTKSCGFFQEKLEVKNR